MYMINVISVEIGLGLWCLMSHSTILQL